jgi:hypothetical protein
MLEFDEKSGVLTWKIVYYGPALSGKTTNLLSLHNLMTDSRRGQMMQLDTKEDRTLFFDLLPLAYCPASGARLKIKVFTVPGQVQYNATRKAVLMRSDGVVFVADSQRAQSLHNSESFKNLEDNARQVGLDFDGLPKVVQFNKRDLPGDAIVSEDEVRARWSRSGLPVFFASALKGSGVMETFEEVVRGAFRCLDARHGLAGRFGLGEDELINYLRAGGKIAEGVSRVF